jgi:hypothetical protein
MSIQTATPWHKDSYDRLLYDRLPKLLADLLPLAGYQVFEESPDASSSPACRVQVELEGGVQADYPAIPRPDEAGLFYLSGEPYVVVPTASQERLDLAEIACVGEQIYAYIQERLGQASGDLDWDAALLRAWLPLDRWVNDFLASTAQRLDTTNWISRHTHLRRLLIPDRKQVIAPGQAGRVCPFETPEGPNIGRVFTIAAGAQVHAGRLEIVDERPEAGLGLSAAMLPFLEHNDPNRLLMAANYQRQSLPAPDPEPALVQTGNEPQAPDFWCGRNLLTAFVSLGAATTADAIVISATAAARLNYPRPVEPGDQLTNRHGIKGVISQVWPDAEMPCLADGTPVELVYSFSGLPTRMTFGPAREALLGRLARAEGQVALAPPFHAPDADQLRARLAHAGLPESGQERLQVSRSGPASELPATVGWVYWNRSIRLAADTLAVATQTEIGRAFGELEFQALKAAGAVHNLAEAFNTRSARHPAAATLASRLAAGPVAPAAAPTPWFAELARRLQTAGIRAALADGQLSFHFAPPEGARLQLARPLPHPWLGDQIIEQVGIRPGVAYQRLAEANERLVRMQSGQAPEQLLQTAVEQLSARLQNYLEGLVSPQALSFGQDWFPGGAREPGGGEPQLFAAKAIAAPGPELRLEQVGLADEIAWQLFEPLLARALGDAAAPARTAQAARALDELMANSWVIVERAPALTPTALLAFRPQRTPGPVIRLHPLACELLNADFDGDQLALYLPVTDTAQREAGEKMTVLAHLQRDPALIEHLLPQPESLWGLAWLALAPDGRDEIAHLLGAAPNVPALLTQPALLQLLKDVLRYEGAAGTLARLEVLSQRGYQVARQAGTSFSPFLGSGLRLPPRPHTDEPDQWQAYLEEVAEAILCETDYADPGLGPQLLAARTRLRNRRTLPLLVGPRGAVSDASERPFIVHHSLVNGLGPAEMFACVAGARRGLAQLARQSEQPVQVEPGPLETTSWNVLGRARQARHPGIVFARAAASHEIDPLADVESCVMVTGRPD